MITIGIIVYISTLLLVIALALRYFVPPSDRAFCYRLIVLLLPIQVATLYFLNSSVPFVPSETDTVLYYQFSQREFDSVIDYFDIAKTSSYMYRQFGGSSYTHILTIIHQFVGDSLFFRKVLSLAALWPLGFAWFAISRLVAGRSFARTVLAVTLALPTLWYPFCVLYRDLLTATLHSIFLASVLLLYRGGKGRMRHASVLTMSALLLFLLRPMTVYINAAVILVTMAADRAVLIASPGRKKIRSALIAAAGVAAVLGFFIVRDSSVAEALQIDNKITVQAVDQQRTGISSSLQATVGPISWPARLAAGVLLFIGSEPTIVSRELDTGNPEQLRGMMNGPWFLLGAPFVTLAILTVVRGLLPRRGSSSRSRKTGRDLWGVAGARWRMLGRARAEAETSRRFGLWVVAGYSLIWFALCVLAWDWTRWRLPVVPALAMLAVWQYRKLTVGGRSAVAFGWCLAIVSWRLLY